MVWFRTLPNQLSGTQLLLETGDDSNGASLVLSDNQLLFNVHGAGATEVNAQIESELPTHGDFIQAVAVIDFDGARDIAFPEQ